MWIPLIILIIVLFYVGLFMDTVIITVVGTVSYLLYRAWINGLLSTDMQACIVLLGVPVGLFLLWMVLHALILHLQDSKKLWLYGKPDHIQKLSPLAQYSYWFLTKLIKGLLH